jgi:hypothetical protein
MAKLTKVVWLTGVLAGLSACGDGDDGSTAADASCASCGDMDAGGSDVAAPGKDADPGKEPDGEVDADGMDAGDGMQAVTIRFKAKLGTEDLVCGQHYAGLGTTHISATPQDFRFYVQEVRLVRKGSTQEERVQFDVAPPFQRAEVALLDFTDAKGSCGASGGSVLNTTIRGRVPVGEYDGIVFVNGVPLSLNHAGPAETAAAPLDDVTLFWGWQGGYRFVIAELLPVAGGHDAGGHDAGGHDAGGHDVADPDAGAHDAGGHDAGDAGHGGSDAGGHGGHMTSTAAFLHMGSTGCSGTPAAGFSCARQARNEVRLTGFNPLTSTVVADLAAVFKTSNLQSPPQCHGIAATCAAPYAAFGVDMDTGKATTTQQVFRVE